MAPMATTYTPKFLKRPAPSQDTKAPVQPEQPPSKRIKPNHFRYRRSKYDTQRIQRRDGGIQDEKRVQDMLTRSITLALEAVGFKGAEPGAVESFRLDTEEYMAHYLADVRLSMLSARRAQAFPQDFLQALHTHQLSLRSLIPHLEPPVPAKKSQYPLQVDGPEENDWPKNLNLLGPLLNGGASRASTKFIPKHFPPLPSMHTYQATAEFPDREQDPRKVREQATEEGRLGEEALRKLVGSASAHPASRMQEQPKKMSAKQRAEKLWLETMEAVGQGDTPMPDSGVGLSTTDGEKQRSVEPRNMALYGNVGTVVNADSRYWRKPAG